MKSLRKIARTLHLWLGLASGLIVFSLHYRLLLPPQLGTTIVDCAVLVFVAILFTGLVNWWPRSRKAISKRLRIHWTGHRRRRNIDLHHVLGFYAWPVLMVIALTGLVWGFEWFNDAVYWVASGGTKQPPVVTPVSHKTSDYAGMPLASVDTAWRRLAERHPSAEVIIVNLPRTPTDAIRFVVNPDRRTYYRTDHYYVDQYSAAELPVDHTWGLYRDATRAAVIRRINYDVHIGAIGGQPGKLLFFVAGLIGAGLPITGCLVWWGKGRALALASPHENAVSTT